MNNQPQRPAMRPVDQLASSILAFFDVLGVVLLFFIAFPVILGILGIMIVIISNFGDPSTPFGAALQYFRG